MMEGTTLELLPFEARKNSGHDIDISVTTITFLEGTPPIAYLKDRVAQIVTANPWLAGRLKTSKGLNTLFVPARPEVSQCFAEQTIRGLRPEAPYDDLCAAARDSFIKVGTACVDKDEQLFKMTLVHTGETWFALIVSMSHTIADGFTFYSIYGMIDPSTSVFAMKTQRVADFEKLKKDAQGPRVKFFTSAAAFLWVLPNLCKRSLSLSLKSVRADWLEAQKKQPLPPDITFLSTNDLLTAWFMKEGGYDLGLMAINMRGRLDGVTSEMAGNYESILMYTREEQNPAVIRKSVENFRTGRDDLPGPCTALRGKFAVVSNWASFHKDLNLPGCQEVVHFPVVPMTTELSLMGGLMLIFRPSRGKLAILMRERSAVRETHSIEEVGSPFTF